MSRYLLKHAYSEWHTHTRTHTCIGSSACHGKMGWRQSRLLGNIVAIYGTFFSLRVLFSFSQTHTHKYTQYWLCRWHFNVILHVNSYMWLLSQQCTFYIIMYYQIMRLFLRPFLFCTETLGGMQWNRKREENECMGTKHRQTMEWNFDHVAHDCWWVFLFMHAYSHEPQLQACFP